MSFSSPSAEAALPDGHLAFADCTVRPLALSTNAHAAAHPGHARRRPAWLGPGSVVPAHAEAPHYCQSTLHCHCLCRCRGAWSDRTSAGHACPHLPASPSPSSISGVQDGSVAAVLGQPHPGTITVLDLSHGMLSTLPGLDHPQWTSLTTLVRWPALACPCPSHRETGPLRCTQPPDHPPTRSLSCLPPSRAGWGYACAVPCVSCAPNCRAGVRP